MASETYSEPLGTSRETSDNFLMHALIGAVVTVVLSFTGFSPLIGGGVAGYLHKGSSKRGGKVGAVSGLIAAIPALAIVMLVFGGLSIGSLGMGELGGSFLFSGIMIFTVLVIGLIMVGLSALGGAAGAYIAAEYGAND